VVQIYDLFDSWNSKSEGVLSDNTTSSEALDSVSPWVRKLNLMILQETNWKLSNSDLLLTSQKFELF
jgi:hypothetical protein